MARYSVFAIARHAASWHQGWEKAWRSPEPKGEYDVIVIGGGGHGNAELRPRSDLAAGRACVGSVDLHHPVRNQRLNTCA